MQPFAHFLRKCKSISKLKNVEDTGKPCPTPIDK